MKSKNIISAATIASILITSSAAAVNVKAASVIPPQNPRLWGQDRYETAVKVSQEGWTSGSDYAVIASGEGYADALCAAPLAKANNAPILLTQQNTISQDTINELKRLNVKHVYIVGGQGVVSSDVENAIKSQVTSDVERLGGQDRYETSVDVAEKLGTSGKIVLASGEGYADGLSAAPVAAIEGMPILLTEGNTLSQPTADYIKANSQITKTYVIGGTGSISNAVMDETPGAERLGGADRYDTNAAVINNFSSDFNFNNVYLALGNGPVGNEFADAISGSALAAKNKNPLIIVDKDLNSSTEALIKAKLGANSTLTVIGGTANLSDDLVNSIESFIINSNTTGTSTGSSSTSAGDGSVGTTTGGGSTSTGSGSNTSGGYSTGGDGGYSGGGSIYSDITSTIEPIVQQKFDAQVASNPNIQNYVKLDTTGSSINLELQKQNMDSIQDIFNTGKQEDTATLISRLDKIQGQLDALENSSALQIDGASLKDTLAKVSSIYINSDGSLNTTAIAQKIQNSNLTYDDFKNNLKTSIENLMLQQGKDINKTTPTIELQGFTINKITDANGNSLYDGTWTRSQVIDGIVNLMDINSTLGSYNVYVGNSYFNVNIQ
jgi:putative cell wall-binding protein